jgi:hypothetical protein
LQPEGRGREVLDPLLSAPVDPPIGGGAGGWRHFARIFEDRGRNDLECQGEEVMVMMTMTVTNDGGSTT